MENIHLRNLFFGFPFDFLLLQRRASSLALASLLYLIFSFVWGFCFFRVSLCLGFVFGLLFSGLFLHFYISLIKLVHLELGSRTNSTMAFSAGEDIHSKLMLVSQPGSVNIVYRANGLLQSFLLSGNEGTPEFCELAFLLPPALLTDDAQSFSCSWQISEKTITAEACSPLQAQASLVQLLRQMHDLNYDILSDPLLSTEIDTVRLPARAADNSRILEDENSLVFLADPAGLAEALKITYAKITWNNADGPGTSGVHAVHFLGFPANYEQMANPTD